jgi:hypothetical protein
MDGRKDQSWNSLNRSFRAAFPARLVMKWVVGSMMVFNLFGGTALAQDFDQRFPAADPGQPPSSQQEQEIHSQQGPLTITGLLQQGYDVVGTHMLGPKGIIFLKKGVLLYACEVTALGQPVSALRTLNCVPVQ